MAPRLEKTISTHLRHLFGEDPVAVRSSAPGEDAAQTSFAGLHESYINVRGAQAILDHVLLVWASLWSDRALLYRQELGLDVEKSAMAVVVQEMVFGQRSGVAFSKNPLEDSQAVIESVYGLNQGLVDGTVEPDQWIVSRSDGRVISHKPVKRQKALAPVSEGAQLITLSAELRGKPPLNDSEVVQVFELALRAESLFKAPQDVEWTFANGELYALQSRPITTGTSEAERDERSWYLSLTRSHENLKALRQRIDNELIPGMLEEARRLAEKDLSSLSDEELAEEVELRERVYAEWKTVYWRECIPFAHGVRLFAQVYNEVIRPQDPYEFMDLLGGTSMFSLRRNELLEKLASMIRQDSQLFQILKAGTVKASNPAFQEGLEAFYREFGDSSWGESRFEREKILDLLLEMATREPAPIKSRLKGRKGLEENFLSKFGGEKKSVAADLLDLARASYQLRDDDNIYLGKVKAQSLAAVEEASHRIKERLGIGKDPLESEELIRALREPGYTPRKRPVSQGEKTESSPTLKARQLVGQPAGPGIAAGKARIVTEASDLFQFKDSEVLVCDAIDPNMTFVVPLASAIVERRGGMLIHGAIIAREYGLPCVTGVPDATFYIKTGDMVTVDGFLGIVIIGEPSFNQSETR
jgi:phosphohistidine swiveling domain-containing protein